MRISLIIIFLFENCPIWNIQRFLTVFRNLPYEKKEDDFYLIALSVYLLFEIRCIDSTV
jgi:hypothetical protein